MINLIDQQALLIRKFQVGQSCRTQAKGLDPQPFEINEKLWKCIFRNMLHLCNMSSVFMRMVRTNI